MAQLKSASKSKQPQPKQQEKQQPPLKQFINFTKTTPGFERSLRLIQALSQIVADVSAHDAVKAARWATAKSQLALTRRYFRFLNFINSFEQVYFLLVHGDATQGAVARMLDLGRYSALGIYVVLEDLTIFHAMDIYPSTTWINNIQTEAYKFWFYGLALSVLGAVWSLFTTTTTTSGQSKKRNEKSAATATLVKRVIVDGCDLMIPGSSLGWMSIGSETVGMAMVLSTVVSMRDVWIQANGLN